MKNVVLYEMYSKKLVAEYFLFVSVHVFLKSSTQINRYIFCLFPLGYDSATLIIQVEFSKTRPHGLFESPKIHHILLVWNNYLYNYNQHKISTKNWLPWIRHICPILQLKYNFDCKNILQKQNLKYFIKETKANNSFKNILMNW